MNFKFYLFLWFKWVIRLTFCSLFLAAIFAFLITAFLYLKLEMPILSAENMVALFELFKFWFQISWNGALLIAMFRSVKYIFNNCNHGYQFQLLTCQAIVMQEIGYGDLVKVWRRWLMLMIWLVGAQMIVALAYTLLFTNMTTVFEWFNIYWLFGFTVFSGYISFIFLPNRCKFVRLAKC